jgi:hypothetical protein
MNTYTIYQRRRSAHNESPTPRQVLGAALTNPATPLRLLAEVLEGQPQTNGRAELLAVVEA